jgi:GDP-L-fucose synthase
MSKKNLKIYLAGHRGLIGSAVLEKLKSCGYKNLIFKTRQELNLMDEKKVKIFLNKEKPDLVILAAARVGGIYANYKNKAKFLYENLLIQTNVIGGSFVSGVKHLIFFGSNCIYPKNSNQPIKESSLSTGPLEKTNDAYAIAKINGVKLCENLSNNFNINYKSLMLCNVFGPNDNYDLKSSHFIPAIIHKIFIAEKKKLNYINLWGDGNPLREVIYSKDVADACIFFMTKKTKSKIINIGSGQECSIRDYFYIIRKLMKSNVKAIFNNNLNGVMRKINDCSLARSYGWKINNNLEKNLLETVSDFKRNYNNYKI